MIPSRIRSNASWLLLFKLNPIDFENVYRDAITMNKYNWALLLEFVFGREGEENNEDNRYSNLGVWVEKNKYFKNL